MTRLGSPRRLRLVPLAGIVACLLTGVSTIPVRAASPVIEAAAAALPDQVQTWEMNLYQADVVRFQNPDWRACTAAATQSMLNLIALDSTELLPVRAGDTTSSPLTWHVDLSYKRQEEILKFERSHMTMGLGAPGTDPHGWRNALNWYGWGSLGAGVYKDSAYSSFDSAATAVVRALARTHKPVGLLAWAGSHAQVVTGYQVTGGDPRVSDNFQIDAIYLTDPYRSSQLRNFRVPYSTWKNGPNYIRLWPYWQSDYTVRDPIDGQIGYKEWRNKYVIEEPVR